ncbi:MAG: helix-turn-helix domain-containing protein [Hyphomicrobiales bacterium]
MSFNIAFPSNVLAPYIKQYWAVDANASMTHPYIHRIIPTGLIEFTFYFGQKPKVSDEKMAINDNSIIQSHHKNYYDLIIEEDLNIFSIVFNTDGLKRFFRIPLNEFTGQNVSLRNLDPIIEKELYKLLDDERDFDKRIHIIEAFFYKRLANDHTEDYSRFNHTVQLIRNKFGNVDIDHLAYEACLSRKQFERKFIENIGVSPKQYLRIIRFQYALYLKGKVNDMSLSQLAYEAGYFDQSHFINEFKQYTGITPKKYFDLNETYSDYFDI